MPWLTRGLVGMGGAAAAAALSLLFGLGGGKGRDGKLDVGRDGRLGVEGSAGRGGVSLHVIRGTADVDFDVLSASRDAFSSLAFSSSALLLGGSLGKSASPNAGGSRLIYSVFTELALLLVPPYEYVEWFEYVLVRDSLLGFRMAAATASLSLGLRCGSGGLAPPIGPETFRPGSGGGFFRPRSLNFIFRGSTLISLSSLGGGATSFAGILPIVVEMAESLGTDCVRRLFSGRSEMAGLGAGGGGGRLPAPATSGRTLLEEGAAASEACCCFKAAMRSLRERY